MTPLLVALGAGIGAALRYWVAHHLDSVWHWGTLAVNVAGSFVLGFLFGIEVPAAVLALLGTGFCGGLTTYSAFAVQTHQQGGARGTAYAATTIVLALLACSSGYAIGQA